MAEIYEKNTLYTVLRPVVDWNTRHSFRKAETRGLENIPEDGAVILAPNHCNTLMDALVVLRTYKGPTLFGARADIFNNRTVAQIMKFLKIVPMVRQRDGLRNVLKNVEIQETILETLKHGVRVCIFPEGTHRPEKSMLPLKKGIFRLALAADAAIGGEKPVYIVPVGIEYGDFFRYRSTVLVTYGKPVNVTESVRNVNADNEARKIDLLRNELTLKMSELFTYINDSGYLSEKWTLAKMISISSERKPYGNCGTGLQECMQHNRAIISQIEQRSSEHPEAMRKILEKVNEFDRHRRKDRISIYSFRKHNTILNITGKGLAAMICLPYFLFCTAASLPLWVLELFIRNRIKDPAFRNTASFGVKLAGGMIWFLVSAIAAYCLAPWQVATLLLILTVPSYSFFHDYIEGMRRFISDIRIIKCRKTRQAFTSIIEEYNNM